MFVCRVYRKLREAMNAQKNAERAAMRAHFRRKYQLSEVCVSIWNKNEEWEQIIIMFLVSRIQCFLCVQSILCFCLKLYLIQHASTIFNFLQNIQTYSSLAILFRAQVVNVSFYFILHMNMWHVYQIILFDSCFKINIHHYNGFQVSWMYGHTMYMMLYTNKICI